MNYQINITAETTTRQIRQAIFGLNCASTEAEQLRNELFYVRDQDAAAAPEAIERAQNIFNA